MMICNDKTMVDFKHLSIDESIQLHYFIQDCLKCESQNDILSVINRQFKNFFDFSSIFFIHTPQRSLHTEPTHFNVSFPDKWLERYKRKRYDLIDPIIDNYKAIPRLVIWSENKKLYKDNKSKFQVPKEAEAFGLINGFSYGLKGLKQIEYASISFSGNQVIKKERVNSILNLVFPHILQAVIKNSGAKAFFKKLTKKESEVLRWIKEGKTSWEISVIFNISQRTVNYHVSNIIQKLEASNKTHAVAIALQNKLIPFD